MKRKMTKEERYLRDALQPWTKGYSRPITALVRAVEERCAKGEKTKTRDFHAGMLAALAVVAAHDAETIYREIVATTTVKDLLAAVEGVDDAEWSGLLRYKLVRRAALRRKP